ncbi:hypothetical protein EAH89_09220 [Roseomonas nepalensis]|uniref:ABC transmembrane type-1 domain-containing protein n=1 Tax=Muricoccus nepalensis TaxID=1854500 RepID=A0A502G927_9PROT|nr:hypothetical protein EAH89_09220 [Roseomonas nepalensis]
MRAVLGPLALLAAFLPLLALPFAGEAAGGAASPAGALLAALAAALLATALGGAAGLGLATRFPGRRAALAVIALPLLLPPVLPGAALLLAAGEAGGVATALWHALLGAPVVAALVRLAAGRIDPALLRAAEACGAPPALAARRLLRPRLRSALALGAALSFGLALGESTVAAMLRAGALPAPWLPVPLAAAALGAALLAQGRGGAG